MVLFGDLAYYFNSILSRGKKDNTYKFALARFLIEYAHDLDDPYIKSKVEENEKEIIEFSTISKALLKYYWHQICKYKIRQNYNIEKLPSIVQIVQEIFGKEYIPESFQSMDKQKIAIAERQITRRCFSDVIPRFQNIVESAHVVSKKVFYEYGKSSLEIKPEVLQFFREHYSLLYKAVILEWAKFLERINHGLPMLISKIEGEARFRRSLDNYKLILGQFFDRCFYCNNLLPIEKQLIHVDHFIPWSYIFEDEMWNLVLSCRTCNLKKHSSLPSRDYVRSLISRNERYSNIIYPLQKSVLRLDPWGNHGAAIMRYYQNCKDYGFTVVDM